MFVHNTRTAVVDRYRLEELDLFNDVRPKRVEEFESQLAARADLEGERTWEDGR